MLIAFINVINVCRCEPPGGYTYQYMVMEKLKSPHDQLSLQNSEGTPHHCYTAIQKKHISEPMP